MTYTPDSRLAGQFGRALRILEYATETVTLGDKRMKRADLACQRAYDHAEDQTPDLHHWEGGGSTTPMEDASDRVRTKRQAAKDHERILKLGFELDNLTREAEKIIARQTEARLMQPSENDDGCKSCHRFGHWAEVDPKSVSTGLCRYCRDFQSNYGQLPPREALNLRHGESPRAAGLWVARQSGLREAAAKIERERLDKKLTAPDVPDVGRWCVASWTDMAAGVERRCVLESGHADRHLANVDGVPVPFPSVAA